MSKNNWLTTTSDSDTQDIFGPNVRIKKKLPYIKEIIITKKITYYPLTKIIKIQLNDVLFRIYSTLNQIVNMMLTTIKIH